MVDRLKLAKATLKKMRNRLNITVSSLPSITNVAGHGWLRPLSSSRRAARALVTFAD